jgi:hypothetical protein
MKDTMEPGSYWSLGFERGDTISQVDLPSIMVGVESLNPYDEKNGWMTLSRYFAERKLLGFAQTGASPEGLCCGGSVGKGSFASRHRVLEARPDGTTRFDHFSERPRPV